MIEIRETTCTGCMACMNACPADAIIKTVNPYGFIMPQIDSERCIRCGLCEKVCPLEHKNKGYKEPLGAYSMYHQSREAVRHSSSGGIFYALACRTLDEGGIVFGCFYDEEKKQARLEDTDHVPLKRLLTSKYVESDVGYGFREVKRQLDSGRKTLFCGTPCQAGGLRAYLQREYENLLLLDFTCGAVSAQSCLAAYLTGLEKRFRSRTARVSFRDKHYGWGQYCMTVRFQNGRLYRKTAMSDPYFFCFLRSSMQRTSCHGCAFSNEHFSDLVLSDFWKYRHFEGDFNERRGVSLVLAMTKKGLSALESIDPVVHREELELSKASYNLKERTYPDEKMAEIIGDQEFAFRYGVAALRKRLLTPRKRLYFALRQWVMDHPAIAAHFPGLVGDGQIMK